MRALLSLGFLCVAVASAQDVDSATIPEASLERARELFNAGRAALDARRPRQAQELLAESFGIVERIGTGYNLALAHRANSEPIQAVALCERILAGELGELSDDQRALATLLSEVSQSEIARVSIRWTNAEEATLSVDDAEPRIVRQGEAFEINPGAHVFEAEAGPRRGRVEQQINPGETVEVHVELVEPEPLPGLEEPPPPRRGWIAAVVAVVVAAGVGVALAFTLRDDNKPLEDDVFGVVEALRFGR